MTIDRRRRERLHSRLPVLLHITRSQTLILSETANLSRDGFYCTTPQPFPPHQELQCLIALPASGSGQEPAHQVYIQALIAIVRLVLDNSDGFGIGCKIVRRELIAPGELPPWALAAGFDRPPLILDATDSSSVLPEFASTALSQLPQALTQTELPSGFQSTGAGGFNCSLAEALRPILYPLRSPHQRGTHWIATKSSFANGWLLSSK